MYPSALPEQPFRYLFYVPELVRFKEASAALSGLCNDGDTLGQTEKEWLIWYG